MQAEVTKNQLLLIASFDDSKYGNDGIFKNFETSFANKKEFRETVMSLTEKEIIEIIEGLKKEIIEEIKIKI